MKRVFIRVYHSPSDQYWDSSIHEVEEKAVKLLKDKIFQSDLSHLILEDENGNSHFFCREVLNSCIVSIFANDVE